ncbi:uncharacterized protein [Rhodnius prolixus]|uniref:uncharacterized protein n=1 Tax=Rhodnius prolixus TaxID=13249 RepID=UPI003D18A9C5
MENPCFEGESSPIKDRAPATVYTIERGPAQENRRNLRQSLRGHAAPPAPCLHKGCTGGWSLDLLPTSTTTGSSGPASRVSSLVAALLLATVITLSATAALLYTLRSVHENYPPADAVITSSDSWSAEMLVSGEFLIQNEPFNEVLYNSSSPEYNRLATRIATQLESLFDRSLVLSELRRASVTSFGPGPGLHVTCSLVLQPDRSLTIRKIGLAFLAGLNHTHGRLWLGPYVVDVRSIGFQASREEVSWSQWSDWSSCSPLAMTDVIQHRRKRATIMMKTRRRVCLSLDGLKLNRLEPCQALDHSGPGDVQMEMCKEEEMKIDFLEVHNAVTEKSTIPTTALTTTSTQQVTTTITTSSPVNLAQIENITSTQSQLKYETTNVTSQEDLIQNLTLNKEPEELSKKSCVVCSDDEVCVALEGDQVPYCRSILDKADPTGCGGLCKLDVEICHRLTHNAFRCIDDSKCLDTEWQCGNFLCIPLIKRCDGHFNCYDHTDEHNCECNLNTHFQCGKNLSCLPKAKRCDGIVDCWDAADESNCTIACLNSTQFTCNDSQCIPSKQFCDGFVDCNDHSDEPFGCGGVCKSHEWRCSNGRCIVKREVCNGVDDCGDSSDEVRCGNRRRNITT